jgi:catalase
MPLPTDEKILALSNALLQKFDALFGVHPGFRPAHAKGIMLHGSFTPSPEAATLSKAPHLNRPSTPATVRFSNSTGIPVIPDNDPNADPRGCAIRFHLADRVHTDIVAHSTNAFPARTGEDFLEFLSAIAATDLAHFPARRWRNTWAPTRLRSHSCRLLNRRLRASRGNRIWTDRRALHQQGWRELGGNRDSKQKRVQKAVVFMA